MGRFTDKQIRQWIARGEHFEGRSDGNGLTIRFRAEDKTPRYRYRYRFAGQQRVMQIGTYADLSLAEARRRTKDLGAMVQLGHDVAADKQQRKQKAIRETMMPSFKDISLEYLAARVDSKVKNPELTRRFFDKDIFPVIGKMKVIDVTPMDIDRLLKTIIKRGSPSVAAKNLGLMGRVFDYAVTRHIVPTNPCASFTVNDAGGRRSGRERWLTREELVKLFEVMPKVKAFGRMYELTIRLLLALCCRKMEFCAAQWSEFDLDACLWHLPAERTKTGQAIVIPLAPQAINWLVELKALSNGSKWLLPATRTRIGKNQNVSESTINMALRNLLPTVPIPKFTVHDLRRTARTHLAALGAPSVVAERALNHKLKGIESVYNLHDYIEERKVFAHKWAELLAEIEAEANQ